MNPCKLDSRGDDIADVLCIRCVGSIHHGSGPVDMEVWAAAGRLSMHSEWLI